jgi:hypothetical protein
MNISSYDQQRSLQRVGRGCGRYDRTAYGLTRSEGRVSRVSAVEDISGRVVMQGKPQPYGILEPRGL